MLQCLICVALASASPVAADPQQLGTQSTDISAILVDRCFDYDTINT